MAAEELVDDERPGWARLRVERRRAARGVAVGGDPAFLADHGPGVPCGIAAPPSLRVEEILARVREIPPGFVRTYGDVDPRAPRLVGHVLATTTQRVPWHRVVRADGSLPMGDEQRRRLEREGVPMRGVRVDLSIARLPT